MKSPLNHIRHHLAKWIPSLQQKENAPERKTITADQLQKICKLIRFPPSHDISRFTEELKKFMANTHPIPNNLKPFWENFSTSHLDDALHLIDSWGFKENIEVGLNTNAPDGKHMACSLHIKNIEVNEYLVIELVGLDSVKFSNNLFHNDATITIIGAPGKNSEFHGNTFEQNFIHGIFNIDSVTFNHNNIYAKFFLNFQPPPFLYVIDHTLKDIRKTFSNLHIQPSFIKFVGNAINILEINESFHPIFTPEKSYLFDPIRFAGGNHISILDISTKHTNVTPALDLKTDVNKIFFDRSDNIEVPENKMRSTPLVTEHEDWVMDNYHISYRRFFALLKQQAAEQHSRVFEDIYTEKVRKFDKKFVSRWEDKIIFIWGDWVSNGGISWKKPLAWLILFQFIFSGTAWISGFSDYFWASFFEFLNPLSGLPSLEQKEASAWVALLHLCHKLVATVTIYEIIKALRRFYLK